MRGDLAGTEALGMNLFPRPMAMKYARQSAIVTGRGRKAVVAAIDHNAHGAPPVSPARTNTKLPQKQPGEPAFRLPRAGDVVTGSPD